MYIRGFLFWVFNYPAKPVLSTPKSRIFRENDPALRRTSEPAWVGNLNQLFFFNSSNSSCIFRTCTINSGNRRNAACSRRLWR
jgi:hypothetical protein